ELHIHGGGEVPAVPGVGLVVPGVLAGVRVEGDDGRKEQGVATTGAQNFLVPRVTVAHRQVAPVELGVVGHGVPRGATATELPPLAAPGLGSHCRGVVLEAIGRVAGHGVKTPGLLAGGCVVGGDIAPYRREIGTAVTDENLAVHH